MFNNPICKNDPKGLGEGDPDKIVTVDPHKGALNAYQKALVLNPNLTPKQFADANSEYVKVSADGKSVENTGKVIHTTTQFKVPMANAPSDSKNTQQNAKPVATIQITFPVPPAEKKKEESKGAWENVKSFGSWFWNNLKDPNGFEGHSNPGGLGQGGSNASKAMAGATLNIVAGAVGLVGESAAAPETGGASLIAMGFSLDQMLEGVNQWSAIINGKYSDKVDYAPVRSLVAEVFGEKGRIIYNVAAIGFSMKGAANAMMGIVESGAKEGIKHTIVLTGFTEGTLSDLQSIQDDAKAKGYDVEFVIK